MGNRCGGSGDAGQLIVTRTRYDLADPHSHHRTSPVAACLTPPISAQSPSLEAVLAAEVRAAHAAGTFDGLVLVAVGDRVVLRTAIGSANRATKRAFAMTDRIPLCSVTKQLTATLIMQEVGALCDRIVVIAHGHVVADASPDQLREQAGTSNLEDAFVKVIGSAEGLAA